INLHDRLFGLISLDGGDDDEWTLASRRGEDTMHAIGPVFSFPQIHIDPRSECSAKNVIHGFNGDFVRIGLGRGDVPRKNHGLNLPTSGRVNRATAASVPEPVKGVL